ncbi:MAG TPA: hypothetical protein VG184_04855 [Acidimicrobiales bacterium]|nr:hypothetical protein [Acidimicrobiales bacterium]
MSVGVHLASGWRVTGVRGAQQVGPDEVRASFSQVSERSVWMRVAPSAGG